MREMEDLMIGILLGYQRVTMKYNNLFEQISVLNLNGMIAQTCKDIENSKIKISKLVNELSNVSINIANVDKTKRLLSDIHQSVNHLDDLVDRLETHILESNILYTV